ncbi:hypothetical protein TorRG33x02_248100 [Trema orientale]|uniref:Uncharacterized protein n=1 Tax=Trema orientale TaxID=63057 RepID=A0A2P5DL77_TREOI|nr:hypothetical protein TorRG33x02_248100 [Trema orientale]
MDGITGATCRLPNPTSLLFLIATQEECRRGVQFNALESAIQASFGIGLPGTWPNDGTRQLFIFCRALTTTMWILPLENSFQTTTIRTPCVSKLENSFTFSSFHLDVLINILKYG